MQQEFKGRVRVTISAEGVGGFAWDCEYGQLDVYEDDAGLNIMAVKAEKEAPTSASAFSKVRDEDIKPFSVPMIADVPEGWPDARMESGASSNTVDEPFMAFDFKGEAPPPAQDLLAQLHTALGWQGGTVHDALAHVRELRERAGALAGLLEMLKAPTVEEARAQIHVDNYSKMVADAYEKAIGTASAVEVAQMRAKAESLDALLETIGVRDVELAKRMIVNERAARLEAVACEVVPLADLREALCVLPDDAHGPVTAGRCLDMVSERTRLVREAWVRENLPEVRVAAPASTNTDPDSATRDLAERWRVATSPIRLDKRLPIATPEPPSLPDPDGGDILLELADEETDPVLCKEILARRTFGIDKHKKPLQRRNGRGHHNDYRQELIDAWAYARAGNVGKNFEALLREMLLGRDPMAGVLSALEVSDVVQAHVRIDELRACEKGLAEIRRVPHVGKDASPLSIADLLKRGEEDRQSIQAIRNSFAELDATPTIRNAEEPVGTQVAKLFDAICGAMCETDLSRAIRGAEYNYNLANEYRALSTTLETIDATVISLGGDPPEVVMVARVEPDVCQRIGKNPGLYSTVKVVIGEGA